MELLQVLQLGGITVNWFEMAVAEAIKILLWILAIIVIGGSLVLILHAVGVF